MESIYEGENCLSIQKYQTIFLLKTLFFTQTYVLDIPKIRKNRPSIMFNKTHTSCDFHCDVLGYAFQNLCLKNLRKYP